MYYDGMVNHVPIVKLGRWQHVHVSAQAKAMRPNIMSKGVIP
jgi:hypothetical protein